MKNENSSNTAEYKRSCPPDGARPQTEADCCKNIICEIERQIISKGYKNCKCVILSEKTFSKLEEAFITNGPDTEKRIYQVNGFPVALLPYSASYHSIEVI